MNQEKYVFIVVGVGGTGSLLARDLPKLLIDTDHKILLIDGDIVEKKNLKRQSYQIVDIGEYKAIALCSKINTFYEMNCEAIGKYVKSNEIIDYMKQNKEFTPVIIGCVDNNTTRKILEKTYKQLNVCYYLDSANGEFEGNIFIKYKNKEFEKGVLRSEAYKFSKDLAPFEKSCEEQANEGNVQYLVTNNKMSNYLLEHINAILNKELEGGVQDVKRFNSTFY